jgi:hypothetical protein
VVDNLAAMVSSNLPNELSSKIRALLGEFANIARTQLQSQSLNLLLFPIFKNHNQFIGLDASTLHVIYTTEGVTSSIISGVERDLRSSGSLTQKQIVEACIGELGYKNIYYFGFPSSLLDQKTTDRMPYLRHQVDQYIQARIRPLLLLDSLGLGEAIQYIQNARARFDTKTPTGYSDCKTNCRNAIVSAIKALTGKENIREGVKMLGKHGIIGEREEELIEAFADFLVKLHGVASKKGPHPPLATEEEDTQLVLNITENLLTYIANRAIKTKG